MSDTPTTAAQEIIDVLERRGFAVRKLAQKGVPDLMVWLLILWNTDAHGRELLLEGVPYLIECKTGKGKLRAVACPCGLGREPWHIPGICQIGYSMPVSSPAERQE